jgi:hypothetical protein
MSIRVRQSSGSATIRTDALEGSAPGRVAQNRTTQRIIRALMTETHPAAQPIGAQIGCAATATFEEMTIMAKLGESASVQGTHQRGQVPKCNAMIGVVTTHADRPAARGSSARRRIVAKSPYPHTAQFKQRVMNGEMYRSPKIAPKLS